MLRLRWLALVLVTFVLSGVSSARAEIPLPEHPRPDFQRADWVNLNGDWGFWFDKDKLGERDRWFDSAAESFPLKIRVPYPWGSTLSGVAQRGRRRVVRAHRAGARVVAGQAHLPGGWRVGLEDRRLARRAAARLAPGRLHPLRVRVDAVGQARGRPAADAARGRCAAELQAGRQAGLRKRARRVADRLSRGEARRVRRRGRDLSAPGVEVGRRAREAVG